MTSEQKLNSFAKPLDWNVTITKLLNNKISLKARWDQDLLALFRKIENKKWDGDLKLWFFPAQNLDALKAELVNMGFEVEIKRFQPTVYINEKEGEFSTAKVEYDPLICPKIHGLNFTKWDPQLKCWSFDSLKTEQLVNFLEEEGIPCVSEKQNKKNVAPEPPVRKSIKSIKPRIEEY